MREFLISAIQAHPVEAAAIMVAAVVAIGIAAMVAAVRG